MVEPSLTQQPVAIVTGGAQGIGLAICRALSEAGYLVAIADLNAEEAVTQAMALGSDHLGLAVDVGSEKSVKATTLSKRGRFCFRVRISLSSQWRSDPM